jgi:ABC-2 type transport system ATP-binding protein
MRSAIEIESLQLKVSNNFRLEVPKLSIAAGAVVGIIGPNGAGKTTLLETMIGVRAADCGCIRIFGESTEFFHRNPKHRRMYGVHLQSFAPGIGLFVSEVIELHGRAFQIDNPKILAELDIGSIQRKRYMNLSRGQRLRVNFYLAAAHCPKLLILDEPTAGLDSRYSRAVRRLARELNSLEGTTILCVSHVPADINLCTDLLWLRNGQIVASMSSSDYIARFLGSVRVEVMFENTDTVQAVFEDVSTWRDVKFAYTRRNRAIFLGEPTICQSILSVAKNFGATGHNVSLPRSADVLEFSAAEA